MLLAACAVVVVKRNAVRAAWWSRSLAQASTREERVHYVTMLAALGGDAVWAAARLLDDPRPEVRSQAVAVLVHGGTPAARQALLRALRDADQGVRDDAAHALAFACGKTAMDDLDRVVQSGNLDEALAACVAIGRMPEDAASDALIRIATTHLQPDLRAQAAELLGLRRASRAAAALAGLARDTAVLTRTLYGQRQAAGATAFAAGNGASVSERQPAEAETVGAVARRALALIEQAPATLPASTRSTGRGESPA